MRSAAVTHEEKFGDARDAGRELSRDGAPSEQVQACTRARDTDRSTMTGPLESVCTSSAILPQGYACYTRGRSPRCTRSATHTVRVCGLFLRTQARHTGRVRSTVDSAVPMPTPSSRKQIAFPCSMPDATQGTACNRDEGQREGGSQSNKTKDTCSLSAAVSQWTIASLFGHYHPTYLHE